MDKDTRNAIERATQRARKLLEEDFAAQLEGDFDVHRDGAVSSKAGAHLSARQAFQRERIVAVIEHKRATGMGTADSVADYLRDAAFTTLNRFVALKMLEARELVQECITKGEQSAGYLEYSGMAPGLLLLPNSVGYRLYIESLFDELSTEVKVLFDRRDPSSVLWPKRVSFEQLLDILNANELAGVWGEDETIGWVYQFFNGQDERRKIRKESQAPRNSRELAVRNQFFTPRYVVQFLTDNTLGRIWYEMHGTKTVLAEKCQYMVRKLGEEVAPRAKKDPRDLRVLDPACGSGHFLLYAFDLLLTIYEEAFADPESPKSEATGKTLAEEYPSIDALRKEVPGLVLAHNLHGVDIDPRCAQIAQLALWMRTQKAYRDLGIGRFERAQIRRSNIVVAEPLVADDEIAKEFVAKFGDAELGRVFTSLVESLNLAGDLGLLLRIEQLVGRQEKGGQTGDLFAPPEDRIRGALVRFVSDTEARSNTRRRLFADDAAHGVALLSVAEKKFDVVLMNPPFGQFTGRGYEYANKEYSGAHTDIFAAFMRRALGLTHPHGHVGCITSRSFIMRPRMEELRRVEILPSLSLLLDLGGGVMDGALVDAAAVTLRHDSGEEFLACDARAMDRAQLTEHAFSHAWRACRRADLANLPKSQILYSLPSSVAELLRTGMPFEPNVGTAREGMKSFDNERFLRLAWEVSPSRIGVNRKWLRFAKGGAFAFLWGSMEWLLNWESNGAELQEINRQINGSTAQVRQASTYWFRPGATYTYRSSRGFSARALPADFVFSNSGPAILLNNALTALDAEQAYLLGWLNSRLVRALASMQANAGKFLTGIFKKMPWGEPGDDSHRRIASSIASALAECLAAEEHEENSPYYVGPPACQAPVDGFGQLATARIRQRSATENALRCCDQVVDEMYGLHSSSWASDILAGDSDGDEDIAEPEDALENVVDVQAALDRYRSWAIGVVLGRWSAAGTPSRGGTHSPFASLPASPPGLAQPGGLGIAVDDPGHRNDLAKGAEAAIQKTFGDAFAQLPGCTDAGFRAWARDTGPSGLWALHLSLYSSKERKAPIYWQLATPSASYSVWLYIHAFSKDTLFRVQNDYAAPKLAHEERRLESLTRDLNDGATPAQRKELAAQQSFVEELRTFLEEVRRVAPLWNPRLDDGVIINFAPLWRLVPHNKSWQKELKSTWDALCGGKYDWSHLEMHLWPERVVPKCAKDRSLAIAHGLDDVFWLEGADGKWTARKAPTRGLEELVHERASPAVKSALKSLVEAPAATGNAGRGLGGRRKNAAEGGNI
jgi:hypothetical protein